MSWGPGAPILRVADVAASVTYYVDVLGFTVDWRYPSIASVSRDRCTIFLTAGDQTRGSTWLWVGVPDAEALHRELASRGAIVRQGPTNFEWALEIQVADPDGNVLRIGSDARPGKAFGPWLDAEGREWHVRPDGSWAESP